MYHYIFLFFCCFYYFWWFGGRLNLVAYVWNFIKIVQTNFFSSRESIKKHQISKFATKLPPSHKFCGNPIILKLYLDISGMCLVNFCLFIFEPIREFGHNIFFLSFCILWSIPFMCFIHKKNMDPAVYWTSVGHKQATLLCNTICFFILCFIISTSPTD